MTDKNMPTEKDVEEIKDRLKIEIPIEEEPLKVDMDGEGRDVAEEFRQLGQQFAETLKTAWNSEERQKLEVEVRDGVKHFAAEVEKAFGNARESERGQKVAENATEFASKAGTSDAGKKARKGLSLGLQKLSQGLDKLSERFDEPPKKTDV